MRQIVCSSLAMELTWGPSARQALEAGAIPDAVEFKPGWWRWEYPIVDAQLETTPKLINPTVRVSVEGGPVLWSEPR